MIIVTNPPKQDLTNSLVLDVGKKIQQNGVLTMRVLQDRQSTIAVLFIGKFVIVQTLIKLF